MNILFLIPARTGSKGIPQKNFRNMLGNPLWAYSLEQAIICEAYLNKMGENAMVCISTDDTSRFPGEVTHYLIDRPNELATDDSPVIDTIKDAIAQVEEARKVHIDCVCLLQPTSPNRLPEDIIRCVALFIERGGKHPVVSGCLTRMKVKGKLDNKKNASVFLRNGAVFVLPRELIDKRTILDGEEYEVEMPKSRSIDIDTMDDWAMAEAELVYRSMYINQMKEENVEDSEGNP